MNSIVRLAQERYGEDPRSSLPVKDRHTLYRQLLSSLFLAILPTWSRPAYSGLFDFERRFSGVYTVRPIFSHLLGLLATVFEISGTDRPRCLGDLGPLQL